MGNFMLNYK